jgi:hypothetical protein
MVIPLLPGSSPLWMAAPFRLPYRIDLVAPVVFLITPRHGPPFPTVCMRIHCRRNVFTSRYLETALHSTVFKNILLSWLLEGGKYREMNEQRGPSCATSLIENKVFTCFGQHWPSEGSTSTTKKYFTCMINIDFCHQKLDQTPYSPLKDNRRFGGTCRFRIEGRRISQARSQHEAVSEQSCSVRYVQFSQAFNNVFVFPRTWLGSAVPWYNARPVWLIDLYSV